MEVNEAQVWQRLRAVSQPNAGLADALTEMITGEWMDASVYLNLSRRLSGRESTLLHQLFEEEQAHAACLKGIYTLTMGQRPQIKMPRAAVLPIEQTLRNCYGREMRSLTGYEAHSSHPEYGHIFARMALQEREHCRIILEILGSLPKV